MLDSFYNKISDIYCSWFLGNEMFFNRILSFIWSNGQRPELVKDRSSQELWKFEWPKAWLVVKDQISQRNSETMGLAKSRIRQDLIKRVAKGRDQKTQLWYQMRRTKFAHTRLIPKYLEYSNQIHMDKYICNKNE